jgi:hypothetical protein
MSDMFGLMVPYQGCHVFYNYLGFLWHITGTQLMTLGYQKCEGLDIEPWI